MKLLSLITSFFSLVIYAAPPAPIAVRLTWDAPVPLDADIIGYKLLIGTRSGVYTTTIDVPRVNASIPPPTSVIVSSGLLARTNYYFVARSYTASLYSEDSNEVVWSSPKNKKGNLQNPPAPIGANTTHPTNPNRPNGGSGKSRPFSIPLAMKVKSFNDLSYTMLLVAGKPGDHYVIQYSDDFVHWYRLSVVEVGSSGTVEFMDILSPYFQYRFYRAKKKLPIYDNDDSVDETPINGLEEEGTPP